MEREEKETKRIEEANEKACEILGEVDFKTDHDMIKAVEQVSSFILSLSPTDEEISKEAERVVMECYGEFDDFHDEYSFFISGAKYVRDKLSPPKI